MHLSAVKYCFFLTLALFFVSPSASASESDFNGPTVTIPLTFEQNRGQVSRDYQYLSRHTGIQALFSPYGVDFVVPTGRETARQIRMRLDGGTGTQVQAEQLLAGTANYLHGSQASRWIRDIATYGQLRYVGVYPGIDLVFHGDQSGSEIEHDFLVSAGTDPRIIHLNIDGADRLHLQSNGDLQLSIGGRALLFRRPKAYQDTPGGRRTIEISYGLNSSGSVSFSVGSYDKKYPLVIDPVLNFSTYFGGSGGDQISAITTDASGNIYLVGSTSSVDFPLTGAEQSNLASGPDAFISKLDHTGHSLIYSTYLGGSRIDQGQSIAVDVNGNVVVSGITTSSDFPQAGKLSSANPGFTVTLNFIASLNASGSALRYSGLLGTTGGTYDDYNILLNRVAFDSQGNAYIAGLTGDPTFPRTPGAYGGGIAPYPSEETLFIAKIGMDGTVIYGATIPETSAQTIGSQVHRIDLGGLAIDSTGAAVVAGTAGTALPTTSGVLSSTFPNSTAAISAIAGYVLKLNPAGSALLFSTYLTGTDVVNGIALDTTNNIYITGTTQETTLPVGANAYQKALVPRTQCGCFAGYVMKLDSTGTTALGATYFNGTTPQAPGSTGFRGIALDASGNVVVGGGTGALDIPFKNPLTSTVTNIGVSFINTDLYVAQLSSDLSTLLFGSSVNANDDAALFQSIATDPQGHIILAGTTLSNIFPTTSGSLHPSAPPEPSPNSLAQHPFIASLDLSVPAPSLCFDTNSVNFGAVLVGTVGTGAVHITNCGNTDLNLSSVTPSDPVVTATQSCSIAPGASCQLQLSYAPTVKGQTNGTIQIAGNMAVSPQVIAFSGVAGFPQVFLPTSINFSDLLVGQTGATAGVGIVNTGNGAFILTNATATGDFQIVQNSCSAPTPPQGTCFIILNFSPTAAGTRTGLLALTDNLTPGNQAIALNGNGLVSAPTPTITGIRAIPQNVNNGSLYINGNGFLPNSSVLWNGNSRPTTYLDEQTVVATLSAADLQTIGEVPVSVTTPGPGGGTSATSLATVYGVIENIQVQHEVFDPNTQLIYATIAQSSKTYANSVVAVDPAQMNVLKTIYTGNKPNQIAISDDGKLLYVGLDASSSVIQITLPDDTVNFNLTLPIPSMIGSQATAVQASALAVVPGSPHTWLVASCAVNFIPCGLAVTVYDDAMARPTQVIGNQLSVDNFIFVSDPSVVYSTEYNQSPADTSSYKIATDGIQRTAISNFASGGTGGGPLTTDGTYIYVNNGQVIDPTKLSVTSHYSQSGSSLHLDKASGRLLFAGPTYTAGQGNLTVTAADIVSMNTLGKVTLFEQASAGGIERFSTNGIFLSTPSNLIFLRSGITGTSATVPPPVTLSPKALSFSGQQQGTTSTAQTVTLTNSGTVPLAISAISVTGDYAETNTCGSTLAAGAVCTISVTFSASGVGDRSGVLSVQTDASTPPLTVALDGTGLAPPPPSVSSATLTPTSLDFGQQIQGTSSSVLQAKLVSSGTAPLVIAGIVASGDFTQTNNCPSVLAPGSNCTISILFTPTIVGARTGNLTVTDNDASGSQTISLTGSGTPPSFALGTANSGGNSATVQAGSTATFNLTLNSENFAGAVSLTCTGAPANATCTVTPASTVLASGQSLPFMVSVRTGTASQAALSSERIDSGYREIKVAGVGLLTLLTLPLWLRSRRRIARLAGVVALCVTFAFGISGCGGASPAGQTPSQLTPAGTYTLSITAAGNGQTATQKLTLVVQ
jgi:hypothetical protein